jgi:mRNA-degrading endonuclease RelE of RelBE toxin-antitoxin system
LAYEVNFTRAAQRQLDDILKSCPPSERRRFHQALDQLIANPYPTNPHIPPGTIRRLSGTPFWKYKVSTQNRMVYSIEGRAVTSIE